MDSLLSFIELSPFESRRNDHFTDNAYLELQALFTSNPEVGDVMRGTGGCRKVRFKTIKRNVGKSGGIRVIYYFKSASGRVYLIDIIDKVKQDNITREQAHQLKELTDLLS